MTTEDDFQRLLDAEPGDWQTRLVFADWLEGCDDPRAEGYRALGVLRKFPHQTYGEKLIWWNRGQYDHDAYAFLPADWFAHGIGRPTNNFNRFGSRREAEDAAARAFSLLPAERRAELLNPQPAQVA